MDVSETPIHQYSRGVKLDREHMRTLFEKVESSYQPDAGCTKVTLIDRRQIWSLKDTKYFAGLQIFNLKEED